MSDAYHQLTQAFPDWPFQAEYPLAQQTYFRVGGPAEVYIELTDREQIAQLVKACHQQAIPLTVLGGSSNVIISDQGVAGVVLKPVVDDFSVVSTSEKRTVVHAGAGVKTALLVRKTVDEGLTGLEFFLGVPGTVGGAVYNNAHYLSHLISQHITRVEVVQPTGDLRWLSHEECAFGYDTSRFHQTQEIIVRVEFSLEQGTRERSEALIREATLYRAQTQPLGLPSSGCIFQNVPNTPELEERFPQFAGKPYVPGGFLIDQAGLKGATQGDIQVSDKHAAFFINTGQGTAADIKTLIDRVKKTVKDRFGAELREEVFWLGKP